MPPDEEEIDFTPDPVDGIDFTPDEPEPVAEAPAAPPKAASTAEGNAAWADSLGAGGRALALAAAARRGSSEQDRARAQYLLQRHVSQSLGTEDTAAPIVGRDMRGLAGVTGAAEGLTLGWADELRGAARAQAGEGSYEQQRDLARADVSAARAQAPSRYALGELAGTAPLAVLPGGGETASARVATQAGIGAGIGTASGAGYSTGETPGEVAEDAVVGGVMGGVMGAGAQSVGEAGRAGLEGLRGLAAGADRARVVAVAPGRGGQIEERIVAGARRLPGGVPQAAATLRRLRIGGGLSSADDVAREAQAAIERIDTETLSPMYDQLDQIAPVNREQMLSRLDDLIARLDADPSPGAEPMHRYLSGMVERFRGAGASGAPRVPEVLTYRDARNLIEPIRQAASFSGPETRAVAQRASREAYSEARRALDDIAEDAIARQESAPGGYRDPSGSPSSAREAVEAFRRARQDRVTAGWARETAEETAARVATRGLFGLRDMLAAGTDPTSAGGIARAMVSRAVGLRESGMRATTAELAQRLVQQQPERLGRWAAPLMQAMQRGASAFAAAHMALSSRDPEYRRALETAGEEAADAAQE